jgi:chromosome partitioning protein
MSSHAPPPAVTYAIANQKGGVAKTTTTISLGAALVERGQAVLAVDLDPQASLTYSLGHDPETVWPSMSEVFAQQVGLVDTIVPHAEMDLAPANLDLVGAEVMLLSRNGRENVLRGALEEVQDTYDTILLDCPPSLGVLTLNALTAADRVLIPMQCETLSDRGLSQLLATIGDVQHLTNPDLEISGIVATMFDGRTRHSRMILEQVRERYGIPLLEPPVRRSVRFAEVPARARSILSTRGAPPGAAAYRVIAAELAGLDVDDDVRAAAGVKPSKG